MKAILHLAFLIASAVCFAQDAVPTVDGTNPPPDVNTETTEPTTTEEAPPAVEEDGPAIPISFDLSRYESAWEKNPFLLKTTPVTQTTVNWGQDWTLASMSKYSGKIRVSIRNKQTNELKRIYNEAKEGDEFRLVKTNFHRSRKEASAVIAKGAEEAELKYDENLAPVTVNNTVRQQGGANGQVGNPGVGTIQNGINRQGQPPMIKPGVPSPNGRVFNSPTLPGGVSNGQPGMINNGGGVTTANGVVNQPGTVVQPGIVNPTLPTGAPGTTPPTISRRRQLIPAPVVSPQSNP